LKKDLKRRKIDDSRFVSGGLFEEISAKITCNFKK
jgi:hypothetical protein